MIAVGRFDVDAGDARAVRHLLRSAWVPRTNGERAALAICRMAESAGFTARVAGLSRSPRSAQGPNPAPALDPALDAVRALLGTGSSVRCPLSLVQDAHSAGGRRLLFLWHDGEEHPFAVAKVWHDAQSETLRREVEGHRAVATLDVETRAGAPLLLASGEAGGLAVLVEEHVRGESLARLNGRRFRAGRWHPALLAATGNWLGRFHVATATSRREAGLRQTAIHGDAWSRNLLVRPGGGDGPLRLTCFVDWEAFRREGDPLSDLLHFLVASGAADLAGRGPRAESLRGDRDALVRWLLLPGRGPFVAVRAFLRAWREQAAGLHAGMPLPELAAGRLAEGVPTDPPGTLSRQTLADLLGSRSALA